MSKSIQIKSFLFTGEFENVINPSATARFTYDGQVLWCCGKDKGEDFVSVVDQIYGAETYVYFDRGISN